MNVWVTIVLIHSTMVNVNNAMAHFEMRKDNFIIQKWYLWWNLTGLLTVFSIFLNNMFIRLKWFGYKQSSHLCRSAMNIVLFTDLSMERDWTCNNLFNLTLSDYFKNLFGGVFVIFNQSGLITLSLNLVNLFKFVINVNISYIILLNERCELLCVLWLLPLKTTWLNMFLLLY
jgi:hypothetical protein